MPCPRPSDPTATFVGSRLPTGVLTVLLALLLALAACTSHQPSPPPAPASDLPSAVARLLAAEPSAWLSHTAGLLDLGLPAVPALLEALHRSAAAPGAPAAVAVLGRIGGPDAATGLLALVAERGPLATEAAQALGELPHDTATLTTLRPGLLACVADRFADVTLRTAAAAALLRHGERRAVADFVRAVLLAGTPAGQQLQARHHLPEKSRWALERYLLQRALLRTAGDDFGLDTDASWPDLEAATQRISQWLDAD